MSLPVVNTFLPPYEFWETRVPTLDEMVANGGPYPVKTRLITEVGDAHAAAVHIANVGCDNGLGNHIQTALAQSSIYKAWQKAMPTKTPPEIARYQKHIETCDLSAVSDKINEIGCVLTAGQTLFHGGLWQAGKAGIVTDRPLSTSLCPQVALRNAEFKAKAYDAGRIDLFVLHVAEPATNAFVFKRTGTNLGHESEILFAAGAQLRLIAETLVRSDYPSERYNFPSKQIPICVLDIELS